MIRQWRDWPRGDRLAIIGILAAIIVPTIVGLYADQARAAIAKTSVMWRVILLPVPLWAVIALLAAQALLLRILKNVAWKAVDSDELRLLRFLNEGRLRFDRLTFLMEVHPEVMKLLIVNLRKKGYLTVPVIRLSSTDELDMIELSHAGRLLLRKRGLL